MSPADQMQSVFCQLQKKRKKKKERNIGGSGQREETEEEEGQKKGKWCQIPPPLLPNPAG